MLPAKSLNWSRNVFIGVGLCTMALFARSAHAMEATTTSVMLPAQDVTVTATSTEEVTPILISAPVETGLRIDEDTLVAAFAQSLQTDLRVVGGVAPYRWSLLASGLPDGVWFDATAGRLYGLPNRTGRFTFTVQVTDAERTVTSKQLTLDVRMPGDPALVIPDAQTPNSQVIIDLDHVTDEDLEYISDVFADDAPLIYVGPNATVGILRINIAQMRIKPHGLYRIEGGTPSQVNETHTYSDVYYVDPNGRRHAFPTESVFRSWYEKDPVIESVPDWKIANIPLRQNVTFRPGSYVRLENTRTFFRVLPDRTLRAFQDEATFQQLITTSGIVPVLPLSQIADYVVDVNPIKSGSDLTAFLRVPTRPAEEMQL